MDLCTGQVVWGLLTTVLVDEVRHRAILAVDCSVAHRARDMQLVHELVLAARATDLWRAELNGDDGRIGGHGRNGGAYHGNKIKKSPRLYDMLNVM